MSTRSHNQSVKITKTVVDKLTPPENGQAFLRDTELKGFGVRITASGVISFIVEKRVNGRVRRMTLGRYRELTVEQARTRTKQVLGQVAFGVDPVAEKRKAQIKGTNLEQAYRDFLKARKGLKEKTLYDYERLFQVAFPDWHKKPLTAISKTMIAKRHAELGQQRGEAYANLAMRFLRSLFNFAQANYDDGNGRSLIIENPVSALTQTRAWFRNERRQSVIKVHQLPAWYQAVNKLSSPKETESARLVADYLLLLLFTGLRREEAAKLKWQHVDLEDRTLVIPDPKNRQPLILPLSEFIHDLLTRREAEAVNEYVFPGTEKPGKDKREHFVEPKRQAQRVIKDSGVEFTLHDLRRTFITVAESLDIPPYAIKRLVNHKINGDVTAGYIVSDVERLRAPVQKISDFLCKATGINAAEILPFPIAKDV